MTQYNMTNKEQVDMIREWWKSYGKGITIAIVIGLAIAFGWRYWKAYRIDQTQKASVIYEQMLIDNSKPDIKSAEANATKLMQHYARTPYSTMAALWWAKQSVKKKDYDDALKKCQWVISHSHVGSFQQIARVRAARILLSHKKPQQALAVLEKVEDVAYQPLIDEVKGDIYTAMNKPDEARKAYQAAKSSLTAQDVSNPILNMKLAQP